MSFGVVAQYYAPEMVYYPDVWSLVKKLGATHVSGAIRDWAAEACRDNGLKLYTSCTGPAWATGPLGTYYTCPDYFFDEQLLIDRISGYNFAQYKNHEGIFGHTLAGEPLGSEHEYTPFDVYNLTARQRLFVNTIKAGMRYIRSQDPTHPVSVALNTAGGWGYFEGYLDRRRHWIREWIDDVDFLDFHLYVMANNDKGSWRDWDFFRAKLREMLEMLVSESKGKPIVIGEMGMVTDPMVMWTGSTEPFTEQNQYDYYRIYGEELKRLSKPILVYPFKLVDPPYYEGLQTWGLYKSTMGADGYNVPKLVAPYVKDFLGGGVQPPPTHTLTVQSTIPVSFKIRRVV